MPKFALVVALVPIQDLLAPAQTLPAGSMHTVTVIDEAGLRNLPLRDFVEMYAKPATEAVVARHREVHVH